MADKKLGVGGYMPKIPSSGEENGSRDVLNRFLEVTTRPGKVSYAAE